MSHRRAFLGSVIGGATGAVVAGAEAAATGRVLGSNERIRFGLIGGGSRGKEIFRAALRCLSAAASRRVPGRARRARRRAGTWRSR
jgi:hypothetical protein